MALKSLSGHGITRRWLVNGLGMFAVILVLFETAFFFAFRAYVYGEVENALYVRASAQAVLLERYMLTTAFDFEENAGELVESFTEKETMELQIVDAEARVLMSSGGFSTARSEHPADFDAALENDDGVGVWRGKNENGEAVMALCNVVYRENKTVAGAMRYVVSLTLVDQYITYISLVVVLLGVAILFLVVLSGSYFINSIVTPVSELGIAARRIALGDYDSRIEKKYNDEIGELCDTINYMAGEIAATEQVKNDFISSVSHELRTPLTAIKGWSETLQQVDGDVELTQKGLEVIAAEAERLSGIVEELLDFSRMQGGRMKLNFDRVDVLAELQEAVFLFRDRARRAGVTLQYVESADLPPITADRDRLKQVFINVIDNAIKYSDTGGRVRIEAASMHDYVQVVISDNGIGIAPEDLPNVKSKFYKADKTRPGSGIGLALADEIVRRHGGWLDIDSTKGVGTTVSVMLPLKKENTYE
ncbi:MAG: HAMP domain-containing protein [Ruminococcaceae bacterium]|nr:HAMP domain-containing protein [Oscillospiraceae bacterium]